MKEQYFTSSSISAVSAEIKHMAGKYSGRKKFVPEVSGLTLLVLDMQHYFLSDSSPAFIPSAKAILPNINKLIEVCTDIKIPVIYTRHINDEANAGMMQHWWSRLIRHEDKYADLVFENATPVISKNQYDAFYNTDLRKLLGKRKQIIICGVMTHLCCETTVRSAFVQGFEAVLPVDATATYTRQLHQSAFNNLAHGFCPSVLTDDLLQQLNK